MKPFLIALLALCIFSSCTSKENKMLSQIKELESNPTLAKSDTLTSIYKAFALQYPKNPNSPTYLHKAAFSIGNAGNHAEASSLLETYYRTYKDSANAEEALFIAASARDKINDKANAKRLFEEYLKQYPNGRYAAGIRQNMEQVGMSPEEIFEKIIKPKQQDSAGN